MEYKIKSDIPNRLIEEISEYFHSCEIEWKLDNVVTDSSRTLLADYKEVLETAEMEVLDPVSFQKKKKICEKVKMFKVRVREEGGKMIVQGVEPFISIN